MFQATRRRLALWYTTVIAVLLLLFASGVFLYVRNTLIERIDDTLNHVAEVVQRSLVIEPTEPRSRTLQVNVESSFRDNFLVEEDDHIDLEWFAPGGNLLWSTFTEPIDIPLHGYSSGETVHLDETHSLRQVTTRVEFGHQVLGYLRVSHPWFEVTKPTRQLFLDLIVGSSGLIGIVAGVGWFLSGLAMQPIRESYQRLKQFTADASHELRNPIAVIQTNVQVALADPDPDPETQRSHLQVIERLTRRLGKLVDDLLFLARQDSNTAQTPWSEVDLAELLQEVLEEQRSFAEEKSIDLNWMDPAPIAPIQGHPDQLFRVFTNLVSNAIQYTPAHGSVSLELQSVKRNGQPQIQVHVRDTGIGIPEEALPKLFDRFYRVDPARSKASGGTGLGLAIVQTIVERHHGSIQVESQEQVGTHFTVTLPQTIE